MKMNRGKMLLSGLLALLVTVAFWIGGFTYFTLSEDWKMVKDLISDSESVISSVGLVEEMSPSLFGFSYRSSGDWARANLRVMVRGDKGEAHFAVEVERPKGKWSIESIAKI